MPKSPTDDASLRACSSKLRRAAEKWLRKPVTDETVLEQLNALALALLVAAELCEIASSDTGADLMTLFDGGESSGPNIYTRMRCLRDLCSAASWSLHVRENDTLREDNIQSDWGRQRPPVEFWRDVFNRFADNSDPTMSFEVTSLLDDALEAILSAAQLLTSTDSERGPNWMEIHRHIDHVRDHFDYAETFLIGSLRAGVEP
jgi:hypothetical protein